MTVFFIVLFIHGHVAGYYPTPYFDADLCNSDAEFVMNRNHLDPSKDSSLEFSLECHLFYNYTPPQGK